MDKETKKDNWWVWVLVIIGGFIVFSIINNNRQNAEMNSMLKQEVNDVNYCRNKAAEYGKQGDAIFSKVYNDCMDAKGW